MYSKSSRIVYEKFCHQWNSCWHQYFRKSCNHSSLYSSNKPKFNNSSSNALCINLLKLDTTSKVRALDKFWNKSSNSTSDEKAIFALILKDTSYQAIHNSYSKLRKRELKFAEKHYEAQEIRSCKQAVLFLSSTMYRDLHYYFYKSFPSPELPTDLLKILVSEELLKLTTFKIKESGKLIGVTFSCLVNEEYCVPFFIYQRFPQTHKGISTFMWNFHVKEASRYQCFLMNFGTSNINSNVARFKLSLGCDYQLKKGSDRKMRYLTNNFVYNWSLRLMPRFLSKVVGYLGYKYFAGAL